jgi:PBSX family phage terminase large subunit
MVTTKKNDIRLMRLLEAARAAGCPRDQIRRFLEAGYIPQPEQLQFHAAARAADYDGGPERIAAEGDRGGAKSHAVMCQVAIDDCQRYPGLLVLYLRKVGHAARAALDQLREKTFHRIPHEFNRHEGIVRFRNGSTIIVGHFKDDRDIALYVGLEYDIIVLEEATQLSESKVNQLLGSLRSSKPNWRTRSYYAANPGGIGHTWFKKVFILPRRTGRETTTRAIQMSWRNNKYIQATYVTWLNTLTGVLARMWRDGDWDVGAGMFFTNWDFDTHVIKPIEIKPTWPVWISGDHGHAHPTAVYWHAHDTFHDIIYTIKEHVAARWLVKQHASRMKTISDLIGRPIGTDIKDVLFGPDVFAQRGHSDPKGGSLTIADEYRVELGLALGRANNDRMAGAAEMLRRLGSPAEGIAATWFIFENCAKLIECLPTLLSDPHRPEDVLKVNAGEDGQDGDDPYDAARYGLMHKPLLGSGNFGGKTRR